MLFVLFVHYQLHGNFFFVWDSFGLFCGPLVVHPMLQEFACSFPCCAWILFFLASHTPQGSKVRKSSEISDLGGQCLEKSQTCFNYCNQNAPKSNPRGSRDALGASLLLEAVFGSMLASFLDPPDLEIRAPGSGVVDLVRFWPGGSRAETRTSSL